MTAVVTEESAGNFGQRIAGRQQICAGHGNPQPGGQPLSDYCTLLGCSLAQNCGAPLPAWYSPCRNVLIPWQRRSWVPLPCPLPQLLRQSRPKSCTIQSHAVDKGGVEQGVDLHKSFAVFTGPWPDIVKVTTIGAGQEHSCAPTPVVSMSKWISRCCASCRGKNRSCGTTHSTECTYKSRGTLVGDVEGIRTESYADTVRLSKGSGNHQRSSRAKGAAPLNTDLQ